MSSTYSSSLRIELIGTGDQAGTWGNTTNTNLGTLMEAGICGYTSVSVASANQALTALNGAEDQSRNAVLALTTSTGANFAVYAPPAEKTYVIYNASSYTATIYNSTVLGNTTAAGTGVAIPAGKTVAVWSDGTNFAVQISHLPSLTLTTDLAVADGGTGASTAANARTNLGLVIGTDVQAYNAGLADIAGLAKTDGNLIVGNGTNWVAESGATARTSLGLGSIATQNSNSVAITGGSITGITDLAVADGGTGASDAAGARTNLGLVIGTNVQAYDAELTAIAALATTDGNIIVGNGSTWVAESGATARTSLGLGSIATQNSNSVAITGGSISGASVSTSSATITGGSITGITDLAVADGGTGASSFTSGSLIKGNGTSALSVASAADIVSAIGSTAVTNATNATNAGNLVTTNFSIVESGGNLLIKYGSTTLITIDSSGNFSTIADVTAYYGS